MDNADEDPILTGELKAIYGDPAVRDRILDYLGGEGGRHSPTAFHLARCDGRQPTDFERVPIESWEDALATPGDLARSLADQENLIAHLDVEYVNFDFPAEAYVDPWRTFRLQEPVVNAIEEELSRHGIKPLHLLTGQGHHFVWQISLNSEPCQRLADVIGSGTIENSNTENRSENIREAAFLGLGLVMEYLGHRIKQLSALHSKIPIELTAVEIGRLPSGQREIISVDLSEYGDPLTERIIRIPFTHYEKPWLSGMVERLSLEYSVPKFVTLPLHEIDVQQALSLRQSAEDIIAMARRSVVRIPNEEHGMSQLLDSYLASPLRSFHLDYYGVSLDPHDRWPETYGRTPVNSFPPCIAHLLTFPNDLLLKPAALQLLTRFLCANGWHPRHIAGLVQSKYEDPSFHWPEGYWNIYNAEMRADFYVRLFASQIMTGLDEATDLNCVSTQERGLCPHLACDADLSIFQSHLKKLVL